MKKILVSIAFVATFLAQTHASVILVPMDAKQKEHLKAYGITFWILQKGIEAHWLLNYRGGSFAFPHRVEYEKECKTRNVSYEVVSDAQFAGIQREIGNPEVNMDDIKLEVAPKIAVYTPQFDEKGKKIQPWDDAVTMVLTYAEIPYEVVYDREVLEGKLACTIGCTCTTKILRVNTASFTAATPTHRGTVKTKKIARFCLNRLVFLRYRSVNWPFQSASENLWQAAVLCSLCVRQLIATT